MGKDSFGYGHYDDTDDDNNGNGDGDAYDDYDCIGDDNDVLLSLHDGGNGNDDVYSHFHLLI